MMNLLRPNTHEDVTSVLLDETWQGLPEYALIVALVSVAAIVLLVALGGGISQTLQSIVGAL